MRRDAVVVGLAGEAALCRGLCSGGSERAAEMARAMFVLKGLPGANVVEQETKMVETRERSVKVEDGDQISCLVVGIARVYGGGHEVEITDPQFVRVVEVKKARRKPST